jgi:hypothetical protein
LISTAENKATHVGKAGTLLGFTTDPRYSVVSQPFGPGDGLIAYTDGVPLPRALPKIHKIYDTYRHLDPDSGAKYMAVEATEKHASLEPLMPDDVSLVWIAWRTAADMMKSA